MAVINPVLASPSPWQSWVEAVLTIAHDRGLSASVSYPSPGLATFQWNGRTRNGVAGAGESMISLTSPEEFTELWRDSSTYDQPVTLTPLPVIHKPTQSLPAKLTAGLPSMTPKQVTPGVGMSCGMQRTYEDATQGNWVCRLGAWVNENRLMAVGLVALAYVVSNGKRKR